MAPPKGSCESVRTFVKCQHEKKNQKRHEKERTGWSAAGPKPEVFFLDRPPLLAVPALTAKTNMVENLIFMLSDNEAWGRDRINLPDLIKAAPFQCPTSPAECSPAACLLPTVHRCLNSAWGFDKAFMPELEHQKRPKQLAMVGHAAFVFVLQPRYIFRIEDSGPAHTFRRQQISCERSQLSLQPFGHRHTKTFLASARHKRRQQIANGAFENVFCFPASQFVVCTATKQQILQLADQETARALPARQPCWRDPLSSECLLPDRAAYQDSACVRPDLRRHIRRACSAHLDKRRHHWLARASGVNNCSCSSGVNEPNQM